MTEKPTLNRAVIEAWNRIERLRLAFPHWVGSVPREWNHGEPHGFAPELLRPCLQQEKLSAGSEYSGID